LGHDGRDRVEELVGFAQNSTLFLAEVTEFGRDLQSRLLRVLQPRELQRAAGPVATHMNVRFVVAVTRDLAEDVRAGRFREDLCLRLTVFTIGLRALRERREDIPILVRQKVVTARPLFVT
jgi:DNA-binding NtrC family response regulator